MRKRSVDPEPDTTGGFRCAQCKKVVEWWRTFKLGYFLPGKSWESPLVTNYFCSATCSLPTVERLAGEEAAREMAAYEEGKK